MSTVGYGDLAPVTLIGRLLTTSIIIVGMGIFSLFTASIVRSLVVGSANRAKRMANQIREQRRYQLALLHEHLSALGASYNPLVALFDPALNSGSLSDAVTLERGRGLVASSCDLYESALLNQTTRVLEENSTEAELMFAQVSWR